MGRIRTIHGVDARNGHLFTSRWGSRSRCLGGPASPGPCDCRSWIHWGFLVLLLHLGSSFSPVPELGSAHSGSGRPVSLTSCHREQTAAPGWMRCVVRASQSCPRLCSVCRSGRRQLTVVNSGLPTADATKPITYDDMLNHFRQDAQGEGEGGFIGWERRLGRIVRPKAQKEGKEDGHLLPVPLRPPRLPCFVLFPLPLSPRHEDDGGRAQERVQAAGSLEDRHRAREAGLQPPDPPTPLLRRDQQGRQPSLSPSLSDGFGGGARRLPHPLFPKPELSLSLSLSLAAAAGP